MTISVTLFLPLSLIFVFLIVIMYVCRATFLSQVLACTSLYVLRIIIIIIIIILRIFAGYFGNAEIDGSYTLFLLPRFISA